MRRRKTPFIIMALEAHDLGVRARREDAISRNSHPTTPSQRQTAPVESPEATVQDVASHKVATAQTLGESPSTVNLKEERPVFESMRRSVPSSQPAKSARLSPNSAHAAQRHRAPVATRSAPV